MRVLRAVDRIGPEVVDIRQDIFLYQALCVAEAYRYHCYSAVIQGEAWKEVSKIEPTSGAHVESLCLSAFPSLSPFVLWQEGRLPLSVKLMVSQVLCGSVGVLNFT